MNQLLGSLSNKHLILFMGSILYSFFLILQGNVIWNHILNILMILLLLFIFFKSLKSWLSNSRISDLFFLCLLLHLGIGIGFSFAGGSISELWVTDSRTMHIPNAINISNWLQGIAPIRELFKPLDKIYFSNIWTGLFFAFFGVNVLASLLAQACLKGITVFFIFRLSELLWSRKIALCACLTYILLPTVLFYSISANKEMMVQLLVAACFYYSCLFFRKKKHLSLFGILISLTLLSIERFYLVPLLVLGVLIEALMSDYLNKRSKFAFIGLAAISLLIGFRFYQREIPFDKVINAIQAFRIGYSNHKDVLNEYNYGIPYPLALLKFIFTPYFTLNKFKIFQGYSILLIWGSFLNQAVMLGFVIQIIRELRKNIGQKLLFVLPILIFFAFFAYFAPYNGRIRDSFYPIFSSFFAAFFLQKVWSRFEKT